MLEVILAVIALILLIVAIVYAVWAYNKVKEGVDLLPQLTSIVSFNQIFIDVSQQLVWSIIMIALSLTILIIVLGYYGFAYRGQITQQRGFKMMILIPLIFIIIAIVLLGIVTRRVEDVILPPGIQSYRSDILHNASIALITTSLAAIALFIAFILSTIATEHLDALYAPDDDGDWSKEVYRTQITGNVYVYEEDE